MSASPTVAIVGAGQAGFQVAASLRELGFGGGIVMYGDEAHLPYQRPPLSKTYLKEQAGPEKVLLRAEKFYAEKAIEVRRGVRVTAIDRAAHTLTLADGTSKRWDVLVLATGVRNRALAVPGAELDGVVMLRGLDDAEAIRARIGSARQVLIVGGGIIGLEMSAFARGLGIDVDIVELGERLAARVGSTALSDYFLHYHRGIGSRVHLGASVTAFEGATGRLVAATLSSGERIETDLALVCIGVVPNAELAAGAGLAVADGIVVDEHMRTSDPSILAVGDCTRFTPRFAPLAGVPSGAPARIRLESVQNAIDQGRCAAETIVGRHRAYDAFPWFWSDQGQLKLQIAGCVLGHDRVLVDADAEKGTMAAYCFAGDTLIGVECINRPADFVAARRLLGSGRRVSHEEVGKPGFALRQLLG